MKIVNGSKQLEQLLSSPKTIHQLPVPALVERALMNHEGELTNTGALSVQTGTYTGRSPKDKFIVDEPSVRTTIDWGSVNQPISQSTFKALYEKVLYYLQQKDVRYASNGFVGADPAYQLPITYVNEFAWHHLFARQLFIREGQPGKSNQEPFTIVSAPTFKANPTIDGTNSEAFVIISFEERVVLIGGTEYAGEMKKSMFSVMNYLMPDEDVLPMHCSANTNENGETALFFGLSGTGKTTLSASTHRSLIGDDEHGWTEAGIFNIEGGCYAKCIHLSQEQEPQIWNAISFGAVLENVAVSEGKPNYDDAHLTENTRAAYPIEAIPNALKPSVAGSPTTIIFLTADAFGVLPPISKLTKEQAMYHFLSGYTSKLAGTERGITQPEATFSTCFGAPFLPRKPETYASMLGEKIEANDVDVFLVNTGWTGGSYGTGSRMKLRYTRAMVEAALQGELNQVETETDPIFGLRLPSRCPGVPDELLNPRNAWVDKAAYDKTANALASKFADNFVRFSSAKASIQQAGPTVPN
ncbi:MULTISPECIES: phosphoenolpyruvate carboxykinase (ATP) [Shouchella]|uniref:Phosphoenolpyruvate carboxykinase (ATP) n=3 Tax=Bacillaceae TaxID=186817 RepID=A0A060M5I9_9BACI|nr:MULTISPECIES: phosphoenolpyruvate carboxykinase (ATP) [Bacillaceae]RQW21167.1 phosphoenolpyruvate carboxykinase (ATP) [Bacillus sp. C1-1]AIC95359.1 phosphoenolpyruvate carboxykinase [Shouchella lehensis G1]KQL57418.1 phosphoenolpyruvate carboxykinase [Alkalicoccobacillus plakortidis]MBG9783844.1 phosphoenolpyruvate carboxykinase [Shouchella lehensis]TES51192.1 phosphoenolpyruvate carboxykinase (ATP) [Shouchella lehensis]